jgi:hypothetical protein
MSEPVPGIFQKAVNFTKAVVKHAATGFQRVPLNVFHDRMNICNSCENKTPEGTCKLCGCFLNIKNTWASEKCPAGKWDIFNAPIPQNISGQVNQVNQTQPKQGGCGCNKSAVNFSNPIGPT